MEKRLMNMETEREKYECWFEPLESSIDKGIKFCDYQKKKGDDLFTKKDLMDVKNKIEEWKRPFILAKPLINKAIKINKVLEKYKWPMCFDGSVEGFNIYYKIMEELELI